MSDRMSKILEAGEENRQVDIELGRKLERERIVKLLRDFKERLYDDANNSADPAWDIERAEAVESCLALIKAEN